ncbi:hypothetical protein BIFGAL_02949 [Bifidobacterium gallicum DSM 20093 = LMG 11596]|uniref:Uncharacterized protein n=1 Tax=Bifidobacterium gallicum DSM 20093 = LMG 11596 TaxID=561180 RepID=D1NT38_9BIFI|nr:hypothetical protein BIFGAL_02949 [Bifidobacterium gallicum DSM 20093 = LMG 11596]
MTAAFVDKCNESRKAAGLAAAIFAGMYGVLVLIVYYTQCTTVINKQLNQQEAKILNYKIWECCLILTFSVMVCWFSRLFISLTIVTKNGRN